MAEKNVILKNSIGDVLYPKIADNSVTTNKIVDKAVTTSKIADGSISKEKLDDGVKQKIDGIVITLNYSGHPGEYEVSESSLSSFSDLETYYNAYKQGVNVYFVIDSVGHGHNFIATTTSYLPVYEFGYRSDSGIYTLMAKNDLFIYTAKSIDESPYLTVTTSAVTAKLEDFSVTTDKILNKAVTKEKLADNALEDITSITWDELKTLRDSSKLIPGHQYRITDYQCTTTQEDTRSTGHQFDIIVTADSTNKLNEKARACLHDGDTYFKNSNLAAWQLWYSLDNDANRFAWADTHILVQTYQCPNASVNLSATSTTVINGVTYYYWYDSGYSYMSSKNPATLKAGDNIYYSTTAGLTVPTSVYTDQTSITRITRPTGVIYRMIDEWNNDCPYDFKNILFKRYKITSSNSSSLVGSYLATKAISDIGLEIDNTDYRMFYTFSYLGELDEQSAYKGGVLEDASLIGNTLQSDDSSPYGVHGNTIKYYFDFGIENSKPIQNLNNIVFLTYMEGTYYGCHSNSFDINNCNISFGRYCFNNSFGNTCSDISFGNGCHNNLFGAECYSISFDGGIYNSFSTNCFNISFGSGCNENSFGRNCLYISLGNDCSNISLGNDCTDSSLGNNCSNISLGTECNHITLGNYYRLNTFDNGVSYVTFDGDGTESNHIQNYHIKQSMVFDRDSEYTITAKPGLTYVLSVAKRSDGTVVEYNEADTHKLVSITDSDYAALATKDNNTLYCILE